jgi:hemoglobin-like flavoprotein
MDPSLRQLFHTDIQKQAQKLFSMISYVVNRLDKIEEIIEEVKALGARHKNYHVQKEHYATVGQALIWTLEQGLGDKWNEDLKAAWLEAYTVLANTMIEASEAE